MTTSMVVKFDEVAENNSLTFIFTTAKLNATGQRWVAALSDYDFCIRFRCGRDNADADGLSKGDSRLEDEGLFPEVLKTICQSVTVTSPLL